MSVTLWTRAEIGTMSPALLVLAVAAALSCTHARPSNPVAAQSNGIEVLSHSGGTSWTVVSEDGHAFVAAGAGLHAYDSSSPSGPAQTGRPVVLPGTVVDLAIADGFIFAATSMSDNTPNPSVWRSAVTLSIAASYSISTCLPKPNPTSISSFLQYRNKCRVTGE